MRVLLTNDDGINSVGMAKLARVFSQIAETTIVAPDRERSATAHAITMHKPLRIEKTTIGNSYVEAWKVNGTPSDCIKLALEVLLDTPPDVVISGINKGHNLGTDIIYSGTVSAAIEATMLGLPAMAISVDAAADKNCFNFTANFASKLLRELKDQKAPADTLLNVNIPYKDRETFAGVYITHLGTRRYKNAFDKRKDPRGMPYFWMAGEPVDDLDDIGSDVWAVYRGYISITPVHFDMTRHNLIEEIKKWQISL